MKLADLEAAANAKLANAHADVLAYISALKGKVRLNAAWIVGGFAAGLLIGWFIGHKL